MKTTLPSVVTGESLVYTESQSVTCKGNVTNDGGAVVSERGICYIKGNGIPTILNKKVSGGSGVGEFACSFNVSDEGTYTYRAFATNNEGTAYGNAKTITLTATQTASTMVRFGNDVWYDDNKSAHWKPSQRQFNLFLDDEAYTKDASVSITPCYFESITGTIVPTPKDILVGNGGRPIYTIESSHYSGPDLQVDYPYTDENNWHEYFFCSIEYFDGHDYNDCLWVPKTFTVHSISINSATKKCSIIVDAVMINIKRPVDYDCTVSYINTAETRTMRIEANNIPLIIE